MKLKTLGVGFLLLAFVGCASVYRDEPIDIYQRSQSYKNRSFGEVWSASLESIDDIGFIVRSATKRSGLIQAVAIDNPDPQFLPPRMNIVIRDRDGTIEVNFHIELPGQRNNTGIRRKFADRFFKALRNNLR
jgi:hypothetical protein